MSIAGTFFYRMESISLHVAAGNIDKDLLHEIISSILYEEDYSEELKLKLIDAFSRNPIDEDHIPWVLIYSIVKQLMTRVAQMTINDGAAKWRAANYTK